MDFLRTDGIIIKEVSVGEADKIVSILTGQTGKITAYARGARKPRNRLTAVTQFLCYSDMILIPGRDFYTVSSAEIRDSFYHLGADLETLTYYAHMTDILNDVIQENQPSQKTMQLFLNSIYMITKKGKSAELITRIFELRLLKILGYTGVFKACGACNNITEGHSYFSFMQCAILCDKCKVKDPYATRLSPGALNAIIHITTASIDKLFKFDVSSDVLKELDYIITRYLSERLEKKYTKLSFLKKI